jgi:hypothetical protein
LERICDFLDCDSSARKRTKTLSSISQVILRVDSNPSEAAIFAAAHRQDEANLNEICLSER